MLQARNDMPRYTAQTLCRNHVRLKTGQLGLLEDSKSLDKISFNQDHLRDNTKISRPLCRA